MPHTAPPHTAPPQTLLRPTLSAPHCPAPSLAPPTHHLQMDATSEWNGVPISRINRHVLYLQADLHTAHGAFGIGYPQVNNVYSPGSPSPDHFLVRNATESTTMYHELGHATLRTMYRGEGEAHINFLWTYIRHVKFGAPFRSAFGGSMGGVGSSFSGYEPDDAAVHWMITPNFRGGNEMDRSNTELDEYRYQHRGCATLPRC